GWAALGVRRCGTAHRAGHSAHGRRPAQSPEGLRGSPHQPGCTSEKSIGLVDAVPGANDRVREWQADTEPALGRRFDRLTPVLLTQCDDMVDALTPDQLAARFFNESFGLLRPSHHEAPRYLIRDRDRIYGVAVTRRLRAMGIRDKPIAAGSPWLKGFVDQLIRTIVSICYI